MTQQQPPSDLTALSHSAATIDAAIATTGSDEDTLATIARNVVHIRLTCARADIIALGESLTAFLAAADRGETYLTEHT